MDRERERDHIMEIERERPNYGLRERDPIIYIERARSNYG